MILDVTTGDAGERLDRFLARVLDQPRNQIQRWIDDGRVERNGRPVKASAALVAGDRLHVEPPDDPPDAGLEPEPGELELLHEDDDLIVLVKPSGLAVHPGAGRDSGTLAHVLLHHYPEIAGVGGPGRPGIVHRLDLDTTGVLVVARSDRAYRRLQKAFAEREVDKRYLAIVYGEPKEETGHIELPIGRDPGDRKRMAVRRGGRPASTRYTCRRAAAGIAWLEIDLETGRTHQIRVHLKAIGHPLVGDPVYGEARWRGLPGTVRRPLRIFPRPALHAWSLAFTHPATGEHVAFEAAVPEDMTELWTAVTGEAPPKHEAPSTKNGGDASRASAVKP